MVRALLVVSMMAGCQDKAPLTDPPHAGACNLDSDCGTFDTCDCGCVARNRNVHAERCPSPCKTSGCIGKQAVCVSGSCELE